jgi:hypothetical protein
LLTGGLKSSRFASIQALTSIGGSTFVVVPVPTVGDGARVEVVMTKRICWAGQRQLRGARLE